MKENISYNLYKEEFRTIEYFCEPLYCSLRVGVSFPPSSFSFFSLSLSSAIDRAFECNYSASAPFERAPIQDFSQYLYYNGTKIRATRLRCKSTRETFHPFAYCKGVSHYTLLRERKRAFSACKLVSMIDRKKREYRKELLLTSIMITIQ